MKTIAFRLNQHGRGRPLGLLSNAPRRARSLATTFAMCVAALCAFTDVKAGPIQLSELFGFLGLLILLPLSFGKRRPHMPAALRWHFLLFLLFLFLLAIGAALALSRGGFVIPSDSGSLLRQPGWISLSRILQLALVYLCFRFVVQTSIPSLSATRLCVRVYVYFAAITSVYGIVSWLLLSSTGIDLGGAYGDYGLRLKAFFVEGGPFGLYAVSALMLLAAQWRLSMLPKARTYVLGAIITIAFLLAQSKSATLAVVVAATFALILSGVSVWKRNWKFIFLLLLTIAASVIVSGTDGVLGRVTERRDVLVDTPEVFGDDPNVLMGRIAGAVIVPVMLDKHILLGIGIGNYSLLRDSNEYNPVLPAVDAWDLHGLGLFGFTAEAGILSSVVLTLILLIPALQARRAKASFEMLMLCSFPTCALIFGVQPTFLYPWVICAFCFSLTHWARLDHASRS